MSQTKSNVFNGRLGIVQRILPVYRVEFIDLLASKCSKGLTVFHGAEMLNESVVSGVRTAIATQHVTSNEYKYPGVFRTCSQRGIKHWLENENPDVLIAEANPRLRSVVTASRWMRFKSRLIIGHGLGTCAQGNALPRLRKYFRAMFLRSFDGIIGYSTRACEEYQRLIPQLPCFVAFNATVSRDNVSPHVKGERHADNRQIVYVGRITAPKKLDLLLEAVSRTKSQPRVAIVGTGNCLSEIKQLAKKIYPRTQFYGHLVGDDLSSILSSSDVFVMPGTGGLAINHAIAAGLPVIVGDGDGTQFDSVRPLNGWHFHPSDANHLTHCIDDALSDQARLGKMGRESLRIAREEINIECMVDSFINAINKMGSIHMSAIKNRAGKHDGRSG